MRLDLRRPKVIGNPMNFEVLAKVPLGQPTMGGPAEPAWRPTAIGPKRSPRRAHAATAGGTIGKRRPNDPFDR